MKKKISQILSVAMLSLITATSSCASSLERTLPSLENRALRISPDIPGFEYQYEICVKRFLLICTQYEIKKEYFDLSDLETRKKLIAMGFVAMVREKVRP